MSTETTNDNMTPEARYMEQRRIKLIAQAREIAEMKDSTAEQRAQADRYLVEAGEIRAELSKGTGRKSAYDDPAGEPETRSGQVRVITREQRMVDLLGNNPEQRGLSVGKYLRGIVTGNWDGAAPERRAMAEGTLASGGYMVPSYLAADVIDAARNAARVMQAGAVTVPMDSATLKIARVATDPTAGWRAENAAITPSDMGFEVVTFTAHTLAAMCKLSVELFEDAQNIDSVVTNALGEALGLELDRAALRGTGLLDTPTGILSAAGVQTIAVDTAISYGAFSQAVQKIAEANGTANGIIYAPRTAGELDRLVDLQGQPLRPLPSFEALKKFSTKQVPTNLGVGTNKSEAYVADFSQLMIGVRTQFVLEASRVAADATGSAFKDMQVWIRAYLRADVQLAKPTHFCTLTGLTPAAA